MPDAIPVRRTSGLPTASFRFHLTVNTLAFSYVLGATPRTQDSHLLERAHAEHTELTPISWTPLMGVLLWAKNIVLNIK